MNSDSESFENCVSARSSFSQQRSVSGSVTLADPKTIKQASDQGEGCDIVSRDVMALSDDEYPSHLTSQRSPRCASGNHHANTAALGASNGISPCFLEEEGNKTGDCPDQSCQGKSAGPLKPRDQDHVVHGPDHGTAAGRAHPCQHNRACQADLRDAAAGQAAEPNGQAPPQRSTAVEAPHEPKALALPPLRVPRRGELTVRLDAFTSSALGSTARRQGARMRLCQSLLSAINTCAKMPVRRSPSAGTPTADRDNPHVADLLYHAAVALLSLLTTSDDLASIGLAFYGAAPTLARVLRAPRTLRDWGARVVVLAVAARVSTVDDDAARQLLREGMMAAVELALHVATESEDWLSVHLCLDLLLRFLSCSADAAAQALACPLLETLVRLLRHAARALHGAATCQPRLRHGTSPPPDLGAGKPPPFDVPTPSMIGAAAPTPLVAAATDSRDSSPVAHPPGGPLRILTSPEIVAHSSAGSAALAGVGCGEEASLAHLAGVRSPLSSPPLSGAPRSTMTGAAVRSTPQPPQLPGSPATLPRSPEPALVPLSPPHLSPTRLPSVALDAEAQHADGSHGRQRLAEQTPCRDTGRKGAGEVNDSRAAAAACHRHAPFVIEPAIGRQPDLQMMKKALRMLSALASQSPAHQLALQQLGVVRLLMAVVHACEHDAVHLAEAGEIGAESARGGGGIAAAHDVLVHALWALTEVVDGCAEAQRDFLESNSMPTVSGMLTRVLAGPALESSTPEAVIGSAAPTLQRRSQELRHAYATHMEIERMAALAVATPRSPLKDTLFSHDAVNDAAAGAPGKPGGKLTSSLHAAGGDCGAASPYPPASPLSAGTPAYLKNPYAHADATLQLLGCPGAKAGAGGHSGTAKATPREAATLLAHLSQSQAAEAVGSLGRLARALALNSGRCKQALQDTATPLLFLQALRALNTPVVRVATRSSMDGHCRRSFDGHSWRSSTAEAPHAAAGSAPGSDGCAASAPGCTHDRPGCFGTDRAVKFAAVGAAVIVACRHVKSRSASRTYRNYSRLCRFSRYIVRWLEFNHAEQQWVALRSWISAAVLLRDPPSDPHHDACKRSFSSLLHEITGRPGGAAPRWPHACGRIPADLGAPPPLVPLEEVASALALIGFAEALQPTDVMDNTLSGVVQMLTEGPASGLTLGACEVLQQMARLTPAVAASILAEGALWKLVQLLISFQDLLVTPPELTVHSQRTTRRTASVAGTRSIDSGDTQRTSADGGSAAGRRVSRCASMTVAAAVAALEREQEARPALPPLPPRAMAVALAVVRTCCVLLEQAPAAQAPFLAMGGVHVLVQLLRELKGMGAPVQPPLFLLLALAARGNPPAQTAAVAEGAPLLAGRVLDSAIAEARSSDVVELQRCCCLALEALLEGCPRAQASIAGTVTVTALERLVPRPSDVMSGRLSRPQLHAAAAAARAIAAASADPAVADEFATLHDGGNIAAALALPPFEDATRAHMRAARVLCMCCVHADMRQALRNHGGLEALCVSVNIAGIGDAQGIREVAVDAVQTLAIVARGDPDSMDAATSGPTSVLPMLVRMLGTGRDSVLAAAAARALADLVRGVPRMQRRAAAAGASEALLFLAAGGSSTATAAVAAAALTALCEGEPAPARAVCAGGGPALLAELLPSCGDAAAEAAAALAALAAVDADAAAQAPALLPQLIRCAGAPPASTPSRTRCAVAAAAAAARLLSAWPEHADGLAAAEAAANVGAALRRCSAAVRPAAPPAPCVWRLAVSGPSPSTSPRTASIPALHSLGSLYQADSPDTDLLVELKLVPAECASAQHVHDGADASRGSSYRRSGSPAGCDRNASAATPHVSPGSQPAVSRPGCGHPNPSKPGDPAGKGAMAVRTESGGSESVSTVAAGKAAPCVTLRAGDANDAAGALEQGWLEVAELAAAVCEASPAVQAALRDHDAPQAVVPLLRSTSVDAALAACVAVGALASGDVQAKRRILDAGGCAALVELLLRGTSSHPLTELTVFTGAGHGPQIPAGLVWDTADAVDNALMRARCGLAATPPIPATRTNPPAHRPQARSRAMPGAEDAEGACMPDGGPEGVASKLACQGTAAALRDVVVMLGAVLDATSASAMQQLSLAMYSRPLAGVTKGVLGATASLAAALTSRRCPLQPPEGKDAASKQHSCSVKDMHDAGHELRGRMAATDARAFAQVAAALDALEVAPPPELPAAFAPQRRLLRRAACQALLKLCSGGLEARKALVQLQRQLRAVSEA